MNDEQAPPVKGIIRALHRGTVLTQRICKSAKSQRASHMLDVLEPAQGLEKSLARSAGKLNDAYALSVRTLGSRFVDGIIEDPLLTNRLQGLTISLLEQIDNLDEYFDEPMAFDVGSFPYLQRQSESCCDQTLQALAALHRKLLQDEPRNDDRAQLSSRRISATKSSFGQASPLAEVTKIGIGHTNRLSAASPNVPTRTPDRDSKGEIQDDTPSSTSLSTSQGARSGFTWRGPPISSLIQVPKSTEERLGQGELESQLIKQHEVQRQMAINDDILEKRRRSRMMFQQEMKRLSSATSSPSLQPSLSTSPALMSPIAFGSPNTSRPESSILMGRSHSREGQLTMAGERIPSISGERMSYGSNHGLDRHDSARYSYAGSTRSRGDSEPFMFGPPSPQQAKDTGPSSPMLSKDARSEGLSNNVRGFFSMRDPVSNKDAENGTLERPVIYSRDVTTSSVSHDRPGQLSALGMIGGGLLAVTAEEGFGARGCLGGRNSLVSDRLPGFGDGIEDEKEAVPAISKDDPEKMLVNEDDVPSTPALSIQSFDFQIKHDASFYRYGGFCEGAKMVLRGVQGAMKIVRKPGGQFSQHQSVKCISCDFEVGHHIYERDRTLDKAGIYAPQGIPDILFRQQLLLKSHLASKLNEPTYACIFCVEDGHTLEDHDATVFFSTAQYFAHIRKHPRPLRHVQDLVVIYGHQPSVVDFDLCLLTDKPAGPIFTDLVSKLSDRPSARALVNHRKGVKGFHERDPEGNPSLTFAIGAKIVGITFPPRFKGDWCCGYHDNSKAYFPASTVQLELPLKDVSMNPKSGLVATSHWDHKRDSKGGWLSFKKGERITHISYPSQEYWCWSGMNSKGSWGLFSAAFVEGLVDTGAATSPVRGPGISIDMPVFGTSPGNSSMLGTSLGDSGKKKHLFGLGGHSRSPDKEHSGWGSKLGRSGTSSFSVARRSTSASIGSVGSGGNSPA